MRKPVVEIKLLDNYRWAQKIVEQEKGEAFDEPNFALEGDAGIDLRNCDKKFEIDQHQTVVKTGLSFAVPKGYCGVVLEKSGLGLNNGVTVHARLLDSNYRGELKVIVSAITPFTLDVGQKITQIIFIKHVDKVVMVDELDETNRGDKGFGSTGNV